MLCLRCPEDLFRSLRLSVYRLVYCDQMVQDRHIVYLKVESESWIDISIGIIFDPRPTLTSIGAWREGGGKLRGIV